MQKPRWESYHWKEGAANAKAPLGELPLGWMASRKPRWESYHLEDGVTNQSNIQCSDECTQP